jgi:hypothetical protein
MRRKASMNVERMFPKTPAAAAALSVATRFYSPVAAFVASDKARSMTATGVNITCGAIVD